MAANFKLLFVLYLSYFVSQTHAENEPIQRVNVVLVGATGDLAKRYLWNGFFNLYSYVRNNSGNTALRFYGAARIDKETGDKTLADILDSSIQCSTPECNETKIEFIKFSSYQRLKKAQDFENLQSSLEIGSTEDGIEVGRIFYLSVPPFAYEEISKNIAEYCRPKSPNAWVRVVLEKPFGSDLETAKELAEKLSKYWDESEIYRIDHYLGKAGVNQIMEFKKENRNFFENYWNNHYIERVNIVLKESVDAKGRMSFYDKYGVIRDVFQNHLTELLVLVASEVKEPHSKKFHENSKNVERTSEKQVENSEKVLENFEKLFEENLENSLKSSLLRSVKPVTIHDAVLGQYEGYDYQLKQEVPDTKYMSNTPTYAAAVVKIQNKRWSGVPFVLVSGKSLDTRLAYVQIKFRQKNFCIKDVLNDDSDICNPRELTFYIQGENIPYPLAVLTNVRYQFGFSSKWQDLSLHTDVKTHFKRGSVIMKPPNTEYDAYSSLIREVYFGNREKFVIIDDLLLSWRIWNPLVQASELADPRRYSKEDLNLLDFEVLDGKIRFILNGTPLDCKPVVGRTRFTSSEGPQLDNIRGNRLVLQHSVQLVVTLVHDLAGAIFRNLRSNNLFHLGLSGGSTVKHLLHKLVSIKYIPWEKLHIWMVDERCVNLTHPESNFANIHENFLKHVPIPYVNIHPMPVDVFGELCKSTDLGDKNYERQLRYHLKNNALDFVVLGVGNDGHTASLFPGSPSLSSTNWIEFTSSFGNYDRMTMTPSLLNNAKNIAVLILGEKKRDIVRKLLESNEEFPITAIKPVNGSLTWYIDENAFD